MLTYSADDLRTLRHDRPPLRAVRKAIFSAHLWRSRATRQSADHSDVNNKSADRDRRLRIGWLNVRSLAKNAAAVCESIHSNNLDVLALTETWHHHSSDICLRDAAPSDFAVVDAVRESQPGYGGIAVLYSGLLRCSKVDLPPVTTFEALCTKFKVGCSAWLLLTVYRPGSSHPTSTFFCELATVLETLVTHGCPVVIGGDINIHVEKPSDVHAACLLELLESMDLQQHVTSITHKAGGTLDLVITFNDCGVEQLQVDPPDVISDHSLITCTVPFHRPAPPSLTRRVRSWKNVDRTHLRQLIVDSSLGCPPPPTATADDLFQTYDDTLRGIADQVAPERTVKCRLRPLSPWFDDECRIIRRKCRQLERRYRRTRDPADKIAYSAASRDKHSFFDQRNKNYWSERIKTDGGSPTKLWRSLSSLLQ